MRFILTAVVLCAAPPAWATTFENVAWLGCYDGDTCTFTQWYKSTSPDRKKEMSWWLEQAEALRETLSQH